MGKGQWDLFEAGTQYVVQQSFKSLSDTFREGERLTFVYSAQSVYHDMLGYFFTDEHGMSRRCDFRWAEFDQIKANLHHWFVPAD